MKNIGISLQNFDDKGEQEIKIEIRGKALNELELNILAITALINSIDLEESSSGDVEKFNIIFKPILFALADVFIKSDQVKRKEFVRNENKDLMLEKLLIHYIASNKLYV